MVSRTGLTALTRRTLLEQIGAIGGAGLTYSAMEALGLAVPTKGPGHRGLGGLSAISSRPPAYAELLRPEGPIVFAGEHLSYQPTWQEGAVLFAHEALKLVDSMTTERRESSPAV